MESFLCGNIPSFESQRNKRKREKAFLETDVLYELEERPVEAELLKALHDLGWLGPVFEEEDIRNFTIALDRIDIVAFEGDYVEEDVRRFIDKVEELSAHNKVAVIRAKDDAQRANLLAMPEIGERVANRTVFITVLERDAAEQWDKLDITTYYDFREQVTLDDIINNGALIEALATAK